MKAPGSSTKEAAPSNKILTTLPSNNKPPTTADTSNNKLQTVNITKTGKKYHRDGCSSLSKSKIAISLDEAEAKGYEPCKKCC